MGDRSMLRQCDLAVSHNWLANPKGMSPRRTQSEGPHQNWMAHGFRQQLIETSGVTGVWRPHDPDAFLSPPLLMIILSRDSRDRLTGYLIYLPSDVHHTFTSAG